MRKISALAALTATLVSAPAFAKTERNSLTTNGTALNGIWPNGLSVNGVQVNGIRSHAADRSAIAPKIAKVRLTDGTVIDVK